MDKELYGQYVEILQEELMPAMGCTEPISLALAAAKAKELLEEEVDHIVVKASGSIIKNTKSVVVPNTGGLRGIPVAVIAGVIGGKAELELEVIARITPEQIEEIKKAVETIPVSVEFLDKGHVFDLIVELYGRENKAVVRITDTHTNMVYLEQNGKILKDQQPALEKNELKKRLEILSIENIWDFVKEVKMEDVEALIRRQMECNWAIAEEGMKMRYGANIGKVLRITYGSDHKNLACAMAAAGSDARMNGCELPVVVNSGSGNQGITVCIPVMVYARHYNTFTEERLIRALVMANMIAIYEKAGIGTLSAYCGAVSAGAGAGAGIAYLLGCDIKGISHTVVNALAISSGIICDGAKASCAGKIALSVYAGILGYEMWTNDQQFYAGDGIVADGFDANIRAIGNLANLGMSETNNEIIRQMIR